MIPAVLLSLKLTVKPRPPYNLREFPAPSEYMWGNCGGALQGIKWAVDHFVQHLSVNIDDHGEVGEVGRQPIISQVI